MKNYPKERFDSISVSNIQCYTQIGVDDTERAIGQRLSVNAKIYLDLSRPGETSEIEDTVSYVALSKKIVQVAQSSEYKLLEHLAQTLCKEILNEFSKVQGTSISIKKPHIPAPEFHGDASIYIYRERE